MEEKREKKRHPLLRALAFLVTLALVLGAVYLVANWQKLNFDSIKRWYTYRSLEKDAAGQVDSFSYDGGLGSSFALVGDDLLVCSSAGVRLYSPAGGAYVSEAVRLENPICLSQGSSALLYDAGGENLWVYRDREQVFSYTAPSSSAILSASLSAQGRLAVVTQHSGLKAKVTVYDSQFQPAMDVNFSSRFVTDAILSPDGATLAVATAGQTGGVFDSQIAFYSLSRSSGANDPDALCSLGDNTVLAMSWPGETLRVVGESSLELLSADAVSAGSYPYNGRYLKGFSLQSDGAGVLLLGQYRAGSNSQLVVLDENAGEKAALPVKDQVLSVSANGRYVSLLTADSLTIYNDSLELYNTLSGTQGAKKVLQRADGSATLIAGETARLYLPQ